MESKYERMYGTDFIKNPKDYFPASLHAIFISAGK